MRFCVSGGAELPLHVNEFFHALGVTIVEGYGLTESMMAAVFTPVDGVHKVSSVGLPLPDVEVRIVDADTGQDVTSYADAFDQRTESASGSVSLVVGSAPVYVEEL